MVRYAFALMYLVFIAGCSHQDNAGITGEVVTAAVFNEAGAPTVEFSVPDMMCPESCAVTVKEILAAQPGVKEVLVDFDSKTATVAVVKDEFKPDAALAVLADRFFVNSKVKSPSAPTAAETEPASPSDHQPAG